MPIDSLSPKKKDSSQIGEVSSVSDNISPDSYRDIGKREDTLHIAKGRKLHPVPLGQAFRQGIESILHYIPKMSLGKWLCLVLFLFLGGIVYILGLMVRTEERLDRLMTNPAMIFGYEGQELIRQIDQDFKVVGIVANNPFLPLEPLASGARLFDHLGDILFTLDTDLVRTRFLEWQQDPKNTSIFPLFDSIFLALAKSKKDIDGIHTELARLLGSDSNMARSVGVVQSFIRDPEIWYTMFGKNGSTRTLLLNQNSEELRAGGGFPGTAFLIDFDGGKLTRFEFYDIYKLDWHLTGYRDPLEGFHTISSREDPGKSQGLEIRDANYFPTFHESATMLAGLTQEAGFGKIDLVVGINQKLLEDMIKLVEPLTLPEVPVAFDHNNATTLLSLLVEGKLNLYGHFKNTVEELAKTLVGMIKTQEKFSSVGMILFRHIIDGEIIVGSSRNDFQDALDSLGLFDRWRGKRSDWVYPLFTSLSANKSDRLMERTFTVDHVSTCERKISVRQKHWFDLIERTNITQLASTLGLETQLPKLLPIQGDGDNVHYLRFILPPGTKLLSSDDGFREYAQTGEHATIDIYTRTKPATTSEYTFRYQLPSLYCTEETTFFKQPGLRNTQFVVKKGGNIVYQRFYE